MFAASSLLRRAFGGSALAIVASVTLSLMPARLAAQATGRRPAGFFIALVGSEYSKPGRDQQVRLEIDLENWVPVGTKIQMKLVHTGLFLEDTETVLELADAKRKGILFDWVFKTELGPDKYEVFTAIFLEEQTAEVQKAIKADPKNFPPANEPWAVSFRSADEKIQIGSEADLAALLEKSCKLYDKMIAELSRNNRDFVDVAEAVQAGKKHVSDGKLDVAGFTAFLKKWQKEQAETQKKIKDIQADNKAVFQRTLPAYVQLENLGRMVSKRAAELQEEIETKYGVPRIRIRRDPKDKSDEVMMYFDANFRLKPTSESMGRVVDTIYELVCPKEEEPEPANADEPADPEGGKPAEAKPKAGA